MSFIDELREKRQKLADVLTDDEYSGIATMVKELYPNQAHCIYELLQNAEDTGATEVKFVLKKDFLTFKHNGRPFNKQDVKTITNIGKRIKQEQENKIGRFGIGFKAVFVYTETPYIWSKTFSFRIEQLVMPYEIKPNQSLGKKTLFKFPFNNPEKPRDLAYKEIAEGLNKLEETTLLFLKNIEIIEWKIDNDISGEVLRIPHSKYHVEILKHIGNKDTSSAHFLRFTEKEGKPAQHVSVAFELDFLPNIPNFNSRKKLCKQLKIVPADPGRVAVFFPAEKETSGLRFHLHAPFVPELSRASVKECLENEPLFKRLATLTVSSLYKIRDIGLLTGDFLGVLPNPDDSLLERYSVIREEVIEEMKNQPLTPTYSRSHYPARALLNAEAVLKQLLSDEDLEFLIEYDNEQPKWAISATQRNSNQDRFLEGLEIEEWDVKEFFNFLCEHAHEKYYSLGNGPDEDFMEWLSDKSSEWHQQMYALLYNYLIKERPDYSPERLKIIRLSDGTYCTGGKCFFPSKDIENDEVLPRVDRKVYQSGKNKNQKQSARNFLEEMGVREVGEAEEIECILESNYSEEAEIHSKKIYINHLKRFIQFVKQDPDNAEMFKNYYIFENDEKEWCTPSKIFLDSPFETTNLSIFYNALEEESCPTQLSKKYLKYGLKKSDFLQFVKAVGVIVELPINETSCAGNPQWNYLMKCSGSRNTNVINTDYKISALDKLINIQSFELSKLIWDTMCNLDEKYLYATFQRNDYWGWRRVDSQLVYLLKNAAWVPQKKGGFVKPFDAVAEQLPKGFPFNEGQEWLEKVDFGGASREKTEEYISRNDQAQNMGFNSIEEAEKYLRLDKLIKESGKSIDEVILQFESNANKKKPKPPTRKVKKYERRKEKLIKELEKAISKKYVTKEMSTRTTADVKKAYAYLRGMYTNESDQMICQICENEMPFKKRNGKHYFEAVEALSRNYLSKEHEAQYLALCPLCAAKYKEFIKRDENAMERFINDLLCADDESPVIEIQLDGRSGNVRFVEPHFLDLKTILEQPNENQESQENTD